jgi:hypothetical protein
MNKKEIAHCTIFSGLLKTVGEGRVEEEWEIEWGIPCCQEPSMYCLN